MKKLRSTTAHIANLRTELKSAERRAKNFQRIARQKGGLLAEQGAVIERLKAVVETNPAWKGLNEAMIEIDRLKAEILKSNKIGVQLFDDNIKTIADRNKANDEIDRLKSEAVADFAAFTRKAVDALNAVKSERDQAVNILKKWKANIKGAFSPIGERDCFLSNIDTSTDEPDNVKLDPTPFEVTKPHEMVQPFPTAATASEQLKATLETMNNLLQARRQYYDACHLGWQVSPDGISFIEGTTSLRRAIYRLGQAVGHMGAMVERVAKL